MQTQWIVIAIVAMIAAYAVTIFNRLVRGRNLVREGWSGIDVQLRRRNDLIPNLVETVKAYAGHERGVFDDITARRTAAFRQRRRRRSRRRKASCRARSGGCSRSPKPIRNSRRIRIFSTLQTQLADTEDQLQMARRYYNGTVRDFNISVRQFPDVLIASALGMREEHFFETDAASTAAPAISFSGS